jgi:replication factor A2
MDNEDNHRSVEDDLGNAVIDYKVRNYDEESLQPCTVGMILNATVLIGEHNELELQDGRKLVKVVIVGAIKEYKDLLSNILYQIEDGTGLIIVKQWIEQNDCAAKQKMRKLCMKENIYVKVVGTVKYYNGTIQMSADSIRPLLSGNEIAYHLLEVVYVGEKVKEENR